MASIDTNLLAILQAVQGEDSQKNAVRKASSTESAKSESDSDSDNGGVNVDLDK
jgi:hypothetical protein